MLFLKNVYGLIVSIMGLLICLIYHNSLTVMRSTNLINEKIFDSQLITLGDYSVQANISEDVWEKFLTQCGNDEHAVAKFEAVLTEEIGNWLMKSDRDESVH